MLKLNQIEFESTIQNLERILSNLIRTLETCEENVFLKGGEGPGTIINVKEP